MRKEMSRGDRVRFREAEESIEGRIEAPADEDGFVEVRWFDEDGRTCEALESALELVPTGVVKYEHPVLAPWRF